MVSSKTEIKRPNSPKSAGLKKRKKRKFKKRYWLFAHLAVAIVIFILLLYKPGRYDPIEVGGAEGKALSKYLTHDLYPQLYNGDQLGEPYDLTVTQEGINDIIAHSRWPQESGDATFSAPAVLFVPDRIVVMGTVALKGVEFVVTIVLEPSLDEQGLLSLRVAKVKVGAMNITPLARLIAKKMYQQRLAAIPINKEDVGAKIAASLLNDESFDPVFKIKEIFENEHIIVRVKRITIKQKKLTLRLHPIPN